MGYIIMAKRSMLFSLALITSLSLGCAGKKVQTAFEASQANPERLVQDIEIAPITEGPYHLGLRLGAPAIEALVREGLGSKLNEATDKAMAKTSAELGDSVQLSQFSVADLNVDFPADTPGIVRAAVTLEGRIGLKLQEVLELVKSKQSGGNEQIDALKAFLEESGAMEQMEAGGRVLGRLRARQAAMATSDTLQWINIRPQIVMRVKMGAEVLENRPALSIEMSEIEAFDLGIQSPLSLPMVQSLIGELGRQALSDKILNPENNPKVRQQIPLPEKAGQGDLPLRLKGIGLEVIPGASGEVFLGIATNLATHPGVTAKTRGAPLGDYAWGVTLGEGTLGLLMRSMAKEGKIPLRFDRQQNPDPEGPIVVQPEAITLNDGGFVMTSRIWNLKFPAFWRQFEIQGNFSVQDGQLRPEIYDMTALEMGEGNLWLGKLVEKKQAGASEMSLQSAGKKTKKGIPLPMGGGDRVLQLDLADVALGEGTLSVMGNLSIQ